MIRTGHERGRGASIFRDLAPIAAAAGAAALTVTLVVGPTTARIRSVSGASSQAALPIAEAGRRVVPEGEIKVRVRPRPPAPLAALTDAFDLVGGGPESSAVAPASAPTFVGSVGPQPSSTLPIGRPDGLSAIALDSTATVAPAETPAPPVLSVVVVLPTVAPPTPGVSSADAPTKRPLKPLRPVKDHATPVFALANTWAIASAEARADRAEARADRADERVADNASNNATDNADGPSGDKPAPPTNDKRVDKSKQ